MEHLSDHRPRIAQGAAFRLSQHYEPEPDLLLFPRRADLGLEPLLVGADDEGEDA